MCRLVKCINGAVRKNRLIRTMANRARRGMARWRHQCILNTLEEEATPKDIVLMMKMTAQQPPFSPRCCVLKFCCGARFDPKNGLSVNPNGDEFERIF